MDGQPSFKPLTPNLGVQIEGIPIHRPLASDRVEVIRNALHKHGLILFKNVEIDEAEQIRFARYFGRISKLGEFFKNMPDAIYVSNARDDGILGDAELTFHSDKFYQKTPPKAAMLYAMEIPARGGDTIFTNTSYVVRTMDPVLRQRLSGLTCSHRFSYRKHYGSPEAKVSSKGVEAADLDVMETCDHPIIARHPWSDASYLAVNTIARRSIQGVSEEESRELVDEIAALIQRPQNTYRHVWEKGDMVFWDNYLLQHARTPFESTQHRTLRRCQIAHELEPEPR